MSKEHREIYLARRQDGVSDASARGSNLRLAVLKVKRKRGNAQGVRTVLKWV